MMITTAVSPKHTVQNQFQLLKFMVSTEHKYRDIAATIKGKKIKVKRKTIKKQTNKQTDSIYCERSKK